MNTPKYTQVNETFLTESEMAKLLNVSQRWLIQDRYLGNNLAPPYIKLGRMVRYPLSAYEKWLATKNGEM